MEGDMGFFQKIEKFFGFTGVKISLDVPDTFSSTGDTITGKVIIKSKSDQHIYEVNVDLEEDQVIGSGENEKLVTLDLGEWKNDTEFDIKAGEIKEIPFTLKYSFAKEVKNNMTGASKTGIPGAVKSNFWLNAMIDVEGEAFDPNISREMRLR